MSLLAKRMKEFNIPEFEQQEIFDNVAIYRLDQEEKTEGGLFIPETARDYKNRGVVVSAGLAAMDELYSAGIEIGHIVDFGRWAGDEKLVERSIGTTGKTVLICKSRDLTGGSDLYAEIKAGKKRIVRGDDGKHCIEED